MRACRSASSRSGTLANYNWYIPHPMTNSPYRTMDDHKRPTEDETLLEGPQARDRHEKEQLLVSDPWRVLRMMGEVVWGFDNLAGVRNVGSIFGSARTNACAPHYPAA